MFNSMDHLTKKFNDIIAWILCCSPLFFLFNIYILKFNSLEAFILLLGLSTFSSMILFRKHKYVHYFLTPFLLLPILQCLSGLMNQANLKEIITPAIKFGIYFVLYPGLIAIHLKNTIWLKRFLICLIILLIIGSLHSYLMLFGIHLETFNIVTGTVQSGLLIIILPLLTYFMPKKIWLFVLALLLTFAFHLFNPHPTFLILFFLIAALGYYFLSKYLQKSMVVLLAFGLLTIDIIGIKIWLFSGIHYWKVISICIVRNFISFFAALTKSPLLGFGAAKSSEITSSYYTFDPAMLPFSESVRSLYSSIGIELGLIGLISLASGFYYIWKRIHHNLTSYFIYTLFWPFLGSAFLIDYSARHNFFIISISLGLLLSFLNNQKDQLND